MDISLGEIISSPGSSWHSPGDSVRLLLQESHFFFPILLLLNLLCYEKSLNTLFFFFLIPAGVGGYILDKAKGDLKSQHASQASANEKVNTLPGVPLVCMMRCARLLTIEIWAKNTVESR